jgi:hypothetical protein
MIDVEFLGKAVQGMRWSSVSRPVQKKLSLEKNSNLLCSKIGLKNFKLQISIIQIKLPTNPKPRLKG